MKESASHGEADWENRDMLRRCPSSSFSPCVWGQVMIGVAFIAFSWAVFAEILSFRPDGISTEGARVGTIVQKQLSSVEPYVDLLELADCLYFGDVKKSVDAALNKISMEWQVHEFPNFLQIMHIPESSWSIQKAKFVSILLDQAQLAAEERTSHKRQYVAGFAGSSITAGHDNYFHEAFPNVFYLAMRPVFESMGMELVVRNHAIGNNPCYPYDACISTHLGDDLDLLAWEQSMNCGHDTKPLDTFTRSALLMEKTVRLLF